MRESWKIRSTPTFCYPVSTVKGYSSLGVCSNEFNLRGGKATMRLNEIGRVLAVVAGIALGGNAVSAAEEPRPVRIEAVPGGYQIALNHATAEMLSDLLANADEKELSELIRDQAQKRKDTDPDTALKLELVALVVNGQLPAFKKALQEKRGPGGVVITVTGLQKAEVTFKSQRLNRVVRVVKAVTPLLPPEAQGAVEAMRSIARTTPLAWKIEPIE